MAVGSLGSLCARWRGSVYSARSPNSSRRKEHTRGILHGWQQLRHPAIYLEWFALTPSGGVAAAICRPTGVSASYQVKWGQHIQFFVCKVWLCRAVVCSALLRLATANAADGSLSGSPRFSPRLVGSDCLGDSIDSNHSTDY